MFAQLTWLLLFTLVTVHCSTNDTSSIHISREIEPPLVATTETPPTYNVSDTLPDIGIEMGDSTISPLPKQVGILTDSEVDPKGTGIEMGDSIISPLPKQVGVVTDSELGTTVIDPTPETATPTTAISTYSTDGNHSDSYVHTKDVGTVTMLTNTVELDNSSKDNNLSLQTATTVSINLTPVSTTQINPHEKDTASSSADSRTILPNVNTRTDTTTTTKVGVDYVKVNRTILKTLYQDRNDADDARFTLDDLSILATYVLMSGFYTRDKPRLEMANRLTSDPRFSRYLNATFERRLTWRFRDMPLIIEASNTWLNSVTLTQHLDAMTSLYSKYDNVKMAPAKHLALVGVTTKDYRTVDERTIPDKDRIDKIVANKLNRYGYFSNSSTNMKFKGMLVELLNKDTKYPVEKIHIVLDNMLSTIKELDFVMCKSSNSRFNIHIYK